MDQRLELLEKKIKELKEEVKEGISLIFDILEELKRVIENDIGASLYPSIAKAINKRQRK